MGIIANQSVKNIITICVAFGLGAVNTLVFYPTFFNASEYGLIVFLLATSNILMPLIGFGVNQTIIKFFSSYSDEKQQSRFMSTIVFLPILIAIPVGSIAVWSHDQIAQFLSSKNPIIEEYVWVIFVVALATSYFEVFYAWARVQLKTVYGNILKEIYPRLFLFCLLISVYFFQLDLKQFVQLLVVGYFIRLIWMMVIAFRLYQPKFIFKFPNTMKPMLTYSFYIFLAGSASSLILDIDKFMIPQKKAIEQTAYYAVAVFIATIVEVPGRAIFQILNPLVSKAINENNKNEIKKLYQKSSLNLLIISGWFFLIINLNVEYLFSLLSDEGYASAVWVVLMISLSKLFLMSFGCGTAIISNASFYKVALVFSVMMAFSVYILNEIFISQYGINGAALSTLAVVVFFLVIRVIYLQVKIQIIPYTLNSIKVSVLILLCYVLFTHLMPVLSPIVGIIVQSIFLSILYVSGILAFGLSHDLTRLFHKFFFKQKRM